MNLAKPETWQSKVARKQAEVKAAIPTQWLIPPSIRSPSVLDIPRQCGILSERELIITESYDARRLLRQLATGQLTSVEVTEAFSKRAAIAQQLTSCLTETMFDGARERAIFLDEYLEREKKTIGPLHGLPVSIKDSFKVKGVQSTIGFVSFLDPEPDTKNSVLVDVLLDLGAVLYVKTNIPQTLMTGDSDNNIFGRTLNPHNTNLTAGGSSGGEAALITLRGSILGVGTDIAGSIRIPSFCCGTYGFKPTSGRIPFGGQTSPALPGVPGIVPCAGPLATCFEDLRLFMTSVINTRPWMQDSAAHAVPWRIQSVLADKKIFTIGILPEDPLTPFHPPVRRTLNNATSALAASGHKIVHLPHNPATSALRGGQLALDTYVIDPSATSIRHIMDSGEPIIPSVSLVLNELPPKKFGILELAALNVEIYEYRQAWLEIFRTERLDVVIAPAAQCTAVPHDTFYLPHFTAMWNLLDYPACIIPYGQVSRDLDAELFSIVPPATGAPYDLAAVEGAPCVIQVAAPRFQDEELLRAGNVIDDILHRD